MINSYKLKADTKSALMLALANAGILFRDADGEPTQSVDAFTHTSEGCIICVYLGRIVDQPAQTDAQGEVTQEATYLDGWHADVLTSTETSFECEIVHPSSPRHDFA